jgi:hypothetical protein
MLRPPVNPSPVPSCIAAVSFFYGQSLQENHHSSKNTSLLLRCLISASDCPVPTSPRSPLDPCTPPSPPTSYPPETPLWNVMPCLQSPKDTKVFPECGKGRLGQWQVYLLDEEYVQVSQLPTLTKTDTDKHDHSQRYTVPDKHTHIFCTNTHMQTCWQGTHRSCLIQIQCHYSHSSIHRHSHRCLFMQQIHLHTDITPRTFM